MKVNENWHRKNLLPRKGGIRQRIDWHVHHRRECGCRPIPESIKRLLKDRKPKLVVSVLARHKNKHLLVNETLEGGKKYWIVPGGKVEFGEELEEAAKRELLEETGIVAKKLEFLCFREAVFADYNYHTVIFFYRTETDSFDLKDDIEGKVEKAGWFDRRQISKLKLVDSARWLFGKFLKQG